MIKNKFIIVALTFLFLASSNVFSQVETTVKETKVKVEKQVEKASEKIGEVKAAASEKVSEVKKVAETMATDKVGEVKKACGPDCKKGCCTSETKEMKASSDKDIKIMKSVKANHPVGCSCEGCKTASAEMYKEHKAHSEDCTCAACAKS